MADIALIDPKDKNTSSENILSFFRGKENSTSEQPYIFNLLVQNKLEDIKSVIESKIMEIIASDYLNDQKAANNPFDSIYLCDLAPDNIVEQDINYITKLSSIIVDKSADIEFDDGLDD